MHCKWPSLKWVAPAWALSPGPTPVPSCTKLFILISFYCQLTIIISSEQCDQMVRLFLNIWPFATMKTRQRCYKFAKVGSAFCQIRNELSKVCQRLVNFCQSGENSPNLVTLQASEWMMSDLTLRPNLSLCTQNKNSGIFIFWNCFTPLLWDSKGWNFSLFKDNCLIDSWQRRIGWTY